MGLSYGDIQVGKLYKISIENGWNHVILDSNPNENMSTPIEIIEPGEIFLILDIDLWDPGEHFSFYEDHMCLYILHDDMVGWIIVLPEDIVSVTTITRDTP